MDKIDINIRHITKPQQNLFSDLGFSEEDAHQYQQESQERIRYALALKEQLMEELILWIQKAHLTQKEAAKILHVTRPRVSDVVNKKMHKFTLDALVDMLGYIGKPIKVVIDS